MSAHEFYPHVRGSSPWGVIQNTKPFKIDHAIVAVSVSTASHGGIWIGPEQMAKIPAELHSTGYSGGGWFEEDLDWAVPYHFLGLGPVDPFEDQSEHAKKILAQYHGVNV